MEEHWDFPQSGAVSLFVVIGLLCISVITIAYCIDVEDEENRIPEVTENLDRVEWSNYLQQEEEDSGKIA